AALSELVERARDHWGIATAADPIEEDVRAQVREHLDGVLIGPAMVALARSGILDLLARGAADRRTLPGNHASLDLVFDLLVHQGWATRDRNTVALTAVGQHAAQIAPAYGVTVSYMPMFSMLQTLLFGNARIPRM